MQNPGLPDDLCLMEMDGTIDLSNQYVAAVPLAVDSETYAGFPDCWISGWGRNGEFTDKKHKKTGLIEYKLSLHVEDVIFKCILWNETLYVFRFKCN